MIYEYAERYGTELHKPVVGQNRTRCRKVSLFTSCLRTGDLRIWNSHQERRAARCISPGNRKELGLLSVTHAVRRRIS